MDFNVHDPSGAWVGIVESPTSAIWAPSYQDTGDFELYFPATSEMLALISDDCCITREDRPETMLVEHVEIKTSAEDGDYIIVSGRGASCLLERRIIWEQTTINGRVDAGIYRLIDENAINPADPARVLPLTMDMPDVAAETIRSQYTGNNLLETVKELCKAHGLGFRVVGDTSSELLVLRFELFKGTDRSEGQSVNSPVIFSEEYENLLSSSYVLDTKAHKNFAVVAGEGEGKARKRATFGNASGRNRREVYVDARDASTNDGEISEADYLAQLSARGAEEVAKSGLIETFDGEIDTSNTFVLGVDYTLGDIVTTENKYGIRKNSRVAAIMESWDDEGYIATPTYENVEV